MADFFEIDFLDVESSKSGDAIPLRYEKNGITRIHVVDGGFQDTGEAVVVHIRKYYGNPTFIDSVVVTHQDGDHAGGLRKVLEEFEVGELWMLRPWIYSEELIDRFLRFTSVENLVKRLKEIYPNLVALEELAQEKGITILEPFQGQNVGDFVIMAPTRDRYLDLVVASDKTPDATVSEAAMALQRSSLLERIAAKAINLIKAAWGVEVFSSEETNPENEMCVVQFAEICGKRILLTADAGRAALTEAADFASSVGILLPGVDRFQAPHHGSRRNVSTEILDRWLGPRLKTKLKEGEEKFTAIISAAKKDEDHPRKSVLRALIHRGARVATTEGADLRTQYNAPPRKNWGAAPLISYPEEQEE